MLVKYIAAEVADFKKYSDFSDVLEALEWHAIAVNNWSDKFPYIPKVLFQIAHTRSNIILHYQVEERYVKAQYVRPNENIWEDSCVEFFISFDNKKHYYNLEFNPLGAGLVGYGTAEKSSRNRLDDTQIEQISTFTQISNISGVKSWSMILVVPIHIFSIETQALSGRTAHANFYKCGDSLPEAHFISWKPISSSTPNFHLPEFFGEIDFE